MYIKNKIWYFLKYISALRFSIFLLLILAFVSVIGTIIEQDQSLDYSKFNYPATSQALFFVTWSQILAFGLNHVYSTYWFFAILLLFFLSLLLCTFSTQLPMLKSARRWSFLYTQSALETKNCYSQMKDVSLLNLAYVLNLRKYYVFHKGQVMYAYKGLTGRMAPIFVHFSIVLALTGSVFGLVSGFMSQEIIPSGEIFHIQNFVKTGYFSSVSHNLLGRVDDFFLSFNDDQSVQQFFSNISLINNKGSVLLKKTISVNAPLRFNGTIFYQTDWRINALRLRIGSSALLVKSLKQSDSGDINNPAFWFCNLILDEKHEILVVVPDLTDKLFLYDDRGDLIRVTRYGLWNVIYGVPCVFKDIMSSTGLQVKVDPGVNFAYLGFLILILSILLSYVSYSQIWASKSIESLYFSGNTNRALLAFENEIVMASKEYRSLSKFR